MSGSLVWLASYPKSGNTWLRVFLTNLRQGGERPADIDELDGTTIASARCIFDEAVGFEAADLTDDAVDRLRPEVYLHLSRNASETLFLKTHDAYTLLDDGRPLFPAEATRCALYVLRNPLDVAVSLAHHNGTDFDGAIAMMAEDSGALAERSDCLPLQLRQKLLSWGGHAVSWLDQKAFPVCLLRYEDMVQRPLPTFTAAVRCAGLPHDPEQLARAIEYSSFEVLQQQEERHSFREKSPCARRFFRKGRVGSWREELDAGQARRIVDAHGAVMRRFGYLDADGEIVF